MDAFTKIINKWLYWDLDSAILTLEPILNCQAILRILIAYAGLGIGVRECDVFWKVSGNGIGKNIST